ncbi:hypothetical protein XI06_13260 [Bradyrhizobium sp. CCBAU 11434]|nr:hypothetical protein [Bradyrhizobium sp. CCBAU 11434]
MFAQSSANPGAGSVAAQHHTTRVLAIGKLTEKAKSADLPEVLSREVPATLELYLRGKIADWYATAEQTEVVFLLNVTSVEEARALLEPLPLGQAGMMTFDLTPIGPLLPLGRLLKAKN